MPENLQRQANFIVSPAVLNFETFIQAPKFLAVTRGVLDPFFFFSFLTSSFACGGLSITKTKGFALDHCSPSNLWYETSNFTLIETSIRNPSTIILFFRKAFGIRLHLLASYSICECSIDFNFPFFWICFWLVISFIVIKWNGCWLSIELGHHQVDVALESQQRCKEYFENIIQIKVTSPASCKSKIKDCRVTGTSRFSSLDKCSGRPDFWRITLSSLLMLKLIQRPSGLANTSAASLVANKRRVFVYFHSATKKGQQVAMVSPQTFLSLETTITNSIGFGDGQLRLIDSFTTLMDDISPKKLGQGAAPALHSPPPNENLSRDNFKIRTP